MPQDMNLAIVHYHLNRGGVTQVIANHLRSLNAQIAMTQKMRIALLYGGRGEGWPDQLRFQFDRLAVSLHAVPGLDYDTAEVARSAELAEQLRIVLQQIDFSPQETIIHVHNHSLGKNVSLPGALHELAASGYGLLLQIHDFAEDFRPENYRRLGAAMAGADQSDLPAVLYPQGPQIHFAVLNRRDLELLRQAGVEPSRLHFLPNAVSQLSPPALREPVRTKLVARFGVSRDQLFVLYPARGIRRKNLGESLLWSALAGGNTFFGLTLPPLNPVEQPSYRRWKRLAATLDLPYRFEVGGEMGLTFGENLAAADLILTTSVAEGFGLVFLESWLAGRRLIGRDLPEITTDFVDAGIRFDTLRPQLLVPLDWIGEDAFREATETAYGQVLKGYKRTFRSAETLGESIDELIQGGLVDFAACSVSMQRCLLERTATQAASCDQIHEVNPWIRRSLAQDVRDRKLIEHNAEVVREHYSLMRCGARLLGIYEHVGSSARSTVLGAPRHGERILDGFLRLTRFRPLCTEE